MSPNRLAGEKSPYLLQHADNPVDWRPWGEEAFAEARRSGRPLLLSIGYAACHWCHVMERESFSDPELAALMNREFVCVKLDREERPDVDALYMEAVQAMGVQGGWPLNVFLTPELKPFFGGTYFPPRAAWGRPGWAQVLERTAALWRERRGELEAGAGQLAAALAAVPASSASARPGPELLASAEQAFAAAFDPEHAGFGGAPKFPMPSYQRFLLRRAARGSASCREPAVRTLRAMSRGGICDQVGGGFHRYSTDAQWRTPHFEKMLYDNAQLLENLADALLLAPDEELSRAMRRAAAYLDRDLRSPEGAFFCSEDADSGGEEGAFYLWERAEIEACLGSRAEAFRARFGVGTERAALRDLEPAAMPEAEAERALDSLLAARGRRPRPSRDDKVLASWNGLALTGLSRAFQATGEAKLLDLARGAARFLRERLWDEESRTLWRRWREGERAVPGLAEDYACVAQGLLDLYEASFDPSWLAWSLELAEEALRRFRAPGGGLWQTAAEAAPELLKRRVEEHDGVEPAAGSVLADAALRLHALTGRGKLRAFAEETLTRFGGFLADRPLAVAYALCALDRALGRSRSVMIAGLDLPGGDQLLSALRSRLRPGLVVGGFTKGTRDELSSIVPVVAAMKAGPRAAAYVCADGACGLPIEDPAELSRALDSGL